VITEKRLEIEVKIKVERLQPLREKIRLLPADLAMPRSFERNIVFDTVGKHLQKNNMLLRLRRLGTKTFLTLKKATQRNVRYKIREETEVEASDFAALEKILLALGFRAFFVYEKYREVFKKDGVRIMVDETPIGDFIEIEGDPQGIDAVATGLGFSPADYIVDSYYRLFLLSGHSGHMVF
jgi:adenylate cyclase class 2